MGNVDYCGNLDHRIRRLFDCFNLDSLASTVNVSEPIIVNKGGGFCCSPSKLSSYTGLHICVGITCNNLKLQPYLDVYNSQQNIKMECQYPFKVPLKVKCVKLSVLQVRFWSFGPSLTGCKQGLLDNLPPK